jgi:hypothetical protein
METIPAIIIRMINGDVPIYARIAGRCIEVGHIQLNQAAFAALIEDRARDQRYADSLYRALNTRANNSYSDAQLVGALSDMIVNTIAPDAWIKLVLSFMLSEAVVDQRIVAALDAATSGLQFCPVCRKGFHRTRKRPRTCGLESCAQEVKSKQPAKRPVSRRDYARLRRQRGSVHRLQDALIAAVAPKRLKDKLDVKTIDQDPKLTEWVEGLAAEHPSLRKALSSFRRIRVTRSKVRMSLD